MKINRIRASIIATLSFFIENVCNCYIVLLALCHLAGKTGYSPWYSYVYSHTWWPVHWRPWDCSSPCWPSLVRHTLLIIYFFKEPISFIGSLDKCHTSVFNALIFLLILIYLKQWDTHIISQVIHCRVHKKIWILDYFENRCRLITGYLEMDRCQNGPLPNQPSVKMAHFQNGPMPPPPPFSETAQCQDLHFSTY